MNPVVENAKHSYNLTTITTNINHLHAVDHLAQVSSAGDACPAEHQVQPQQQDNGSVANVSVHNTVQEGERCGREQRGVGLFVPRNAVCIHELLNKPRKNIKRETAAEQQTTISRQARQMFKKYPNTTTMSGSHDYEHPEGFPS